MIEYGMDVLLVFILIIHTNVKGGVCGATRHFPRTDTFYFQGSRHLRDLNADQCQTCSILVR